MSEFQRGKVRIVTITGVMVDVTPVSYADVRMLEEAADKKFPSVRDEYLVPMTKAIDPKATKIDPERMEEFESREEAVRLARDKWMNEQCIYLAISFPQPKEQILMHLAGEIAKRREVFGDTLSSDDWEVAYEYCILSRYEKSIVLQIASNAMPITEAETDEQLRLFLPKVQRDGIQYIGQPTPSVPQRAEQSDT